MTRELNLCLRSACAPTRQSGHPKLILILFSSFIDTSHVDTSTIPTVEHINPMSGLSAHMKISAHAAASVSQACERMRAPCGSPSLKSGSSGSAPRRAARCSTYRAERSPS
ncbi:hypothetical protein A0H81_10319 [Grifola frondosa]|uniref:Uncharacterized protein n=1 Tax=Grifola frondosa TaxID=5627 RepID=A0A1C7M0J3_GRIFR|nr:hypothetical protein A0H81_10319 [Grifola frondosa]